MTSKTLSARWATKSGIRDAIWKRNKLEVGPGQDPAKIREGYHLEESEITTRDGRTIITVELWKRVDQEVRVLTPSIEVSKPEEESKIGDLLK